MKRLLLALLATHNLVHAGVIMVDDVAAKKQASAGNGVAAAATANAAAAPANPQSVAVTPTTSTSSAAKSAVPTSASVAAPASVNAAVAPSSLQTAAVTPAAATAAAPKNSVSTNVVPAASAPVDIALQRRVYHLKFSDVTIRLAMKRWLKESGMQLAYEAQKDFPVPVEGDYTGPISDVTFKLMTSLSESSYPLRACEYDNRVVLVVHRDDKCPLEDKQ